jgi:putative tryptophan/tyrosine transport system substrate-binding protein
MSYGLDLAILSGRAADFVDKILRGAKPGELPIEQPTKFNLTIKPRDGRSARTRRPPVLLTIADEVIE